MRRCSSLRRGVLELLKLVKSCLALGRFIASFPFHFGSQGPAKRLLSTSALLPLIQLLWAEMQQSSNPHLSFHVHSLAKAVAIAFFLFHSVTRASSAALKGDPASSLGRIPRSQQAVHDELTGAHNFQLSYKVSQSISDDPFYTAPANSSGAPAGTLLKVGRGANTSLYTLPPSPSLSRIMYQSKTSNDTLVPVSGFILWPYAARPHEGGIPVVAWAHGTSGIAPECAPSNIQSL